MTVLACDAAVGRSELLRQLDAAAPPDWPKVAIETAWGSVGWAGDGVELVDQWLILGRPGADPWGWPGRAVNATDLRRRLVRNGPPAMLTATGPFLAMDLTTGQTLVAPNGLIPFFANARGGGSNSSELAAALGGPGSRIVKVRPEHQPGLDRTERTALIGQRVRAELLEHRPSGNAAGLVLMPGERDSYWGTGLASVARIRHMIEYVAPHYWWEGRLRGKWTWAPALERPTIDRLLAAGS